MVCLEWADPPSGSDSPRYPVYLIASDISGKLEDEMPDPYVIEPPEPKRKEIERDRKLDRIIDLLSPHSSNDDDGDDGDSPEVTFEADPDQLPTEVGDEEPEEEDEDDDAGQSEGTHNVADQSRERRFRHPSAKRRPMVEV